MKTKITAKLSHKDLVILLSTALYGSYWFKASYDKDIHRTLKNTEGDSFEDKLADMLLSGNNITITDFEAEGESYSKKCIGFDGDAAKYEVSLKDFLKTASTKRGVELVDEVLSGDGGYWSADAFLQQVVFGEEIYV